jgi:hypothetical protein
MSFMRRHIKLVVVVACCALVGAGAGVITSAGAASSSTATTTTGHGVHWRLGARRLLARSVHGDLLVASKSGLVSVTFDRGVVRSVNGQQLTLTEGAKTSTPKTVTLTIPANAEVRDNGHPATLGEVGSGQRAIVVQAPKQTYVIARTPRSS